MEIGGILLVPIIVALVEVAKSYFGLPSKFALLLNAILSVVGFALVQAVGLNPEIEPWVVTVLQALIVFLSAAGLYREVVEKGVRGEG